jgi:hypothetical protein
MTWTPRVTRQFDFAYCSQESQETVSSQSRSVYVDQTAHGSNVFMDHQSFLRYQEADTQVGDGTGNLLPPLGMFPQAPILTGDHPYPPCCLAWILWCVFFDGFFSSTHLFNLSCSIHRCVWWTVLHSSTSRIHQSAGVSGVLYASVTGGHRLRVFNWPQNKQCRAEWSEANQAEQSIQDGFVYYESMKRKLKR